ncbi:hypothetical protein [Massilia sp.]
MHYWTADRSTEADLRQRVRRLAMRTKPLSVAYIQQQLSFLHALCE